MDHKINPFFEAVFTRSPTTLSPTQEPTHMPTEVCNGIWISGTNSVIKSYAYKIHPS